MNITTDFLAKADEVRNRKIPEKVLLRARQSLLDYLAVTTAGAVFQKDKVRNYMHFAQPEKGDFSALGCGCKLALKEAVFLNGLNSHALDFDDGTNSGIIHLGAPIFSLLLPLAQRYDTSLEEVLRAAVIGYEVSYTMAVSMQPGHKALGYHATGTCGVLGAVIAASYMLGFSNEERFNAFAAACVSATGMLSVLDDGSELKPYNVAKTVLLSLTSLQLATAGFQGNPDSLGNHRGYLRMMTGRDDVKIKPFLLNNTYAIMKSYTKPYASCRYTHPSVEAAIHLREQIKAEDIGRIDIITYSLAVAGHDHTDIQGAYSAKMSIPYATAVGWIYGKAGLEEFSDKNVVDENILRLVKKIHVNSDDMLSSLFPEIQAAVIRVTAKDGKTITNRVDYPKGEPENPLSNEEFKERYDALMTYAEINPESSNAVYDLVYKRGIMAKEIISHL